ncbi:MAG: hypothetical protein ACREMQ_11945 [Longimicrobiales bacterium]
MSTPVDFQPAQLREISSGYDRRGYPFNGPIARLRLVSAASGPPNTTASATILAP